METLTLGQVIAAVVLISAAMTAVVQIISPISRKVKKIDKIETDLELLSDRVDDIVEQRENTVSELKEIIFAIGLGQVQVMNHIIDDNHIEPLKEARDELQRKLIRK